MWGVHCVGGVHCVWGAGPHHPREPVPVGAAVGAAPVARVGEVVAEPPHPDHLPHRVEGVRRCGKV